MSTLQTTVTVGPDAQGVAEPAWDIPYKGSDGRRRVGLLIEPVDVFFCRDGRPFGASTVGAGGLPHPQVIAGALRTHALLQLQAPLARFPINRPRRAGAEAKEWSTRAFEAWREELSLFGTPWILDMRCRGPWLYNTGTPSKSNGGEESLDAGVYVPTPADVMRPKGEKDLPYVLVRPEDPAKLPGWPKPSALWPLWQSDATHDLEAAGGYISGGELKTWLGGEPPHRVAAPSSFYDYEYRTGIQVDADRLAAEDRMIYSIRMVRLKPGIALYAEIDFLGGMPTSDQQARVFPAAGWAIRLGGEGKLARVRVVPPIAWRADESRPGNAASGGANDLLLLTTPAAFDKPADAPAAQWRYALPDFAGRWNRRLIAAAVPGYVAISGWDLARRCPKPTRHFVPAGSVYFLDGAGNENAPNLVNSDDAIQGYGICLKGTWNHG